MLRELKLNLGRWAETFPLGNHSVYCFTEAVEEKDIDFAARMFSPGMGIGEDPGTGIAGRGADRASRAACEFRRRPG